MNILFHGPSGSGKDTQADLLVEKFNFEKIGTGEMFRRMYTEGDPDAVEAHKYYSKGYFVPNDIVYRMFNKWIDSFDVNKDWLFVSVVREKGQISLLDNLLREKGKKLDFFVHFVLREEVAIERRALRWTCPKCEIPYHKKYTPEKLEGFCDNCNGKLIQREDDTPEMTRSLLAEYNKTIAPILKEYRRRGVLVEIDAGPTIEEIHKEVIKALCL
jgi:adenylate kinase